MKSFKNPWITPHYIFVVSTFSSAKSMSEFLFYFSHSLTARIKLAMNLPKGNTVTYAYEDKNHKIFLNRLCMQEVLNKCKR